MISNITIAGLNIMAVATRRDMWYLSAIKYTNLSNPYTRTPTTENVAIIMAPSSTGTLMALPKARAIKIIWPNMRWCDLPDRNNFSVKEN